MVLARFQMVGYLRDGPSLGLKPSLTAGVCFSGKQICRRNYPLRSFVASLVSAPSAQAVS